MSRPFVEDLEAAQVEDDVVAVDELGVGAEGAHVAGALVLGHHLVRAYAAKASAGWRT
jgi:hypothetical protein